MASEKTLSFQNKNIFYQLAGDGPQVVLLHGIPADGNLWRNQLAIPGFRFIMPDLPGSGRSEMIPDMSVEGMAEVVAAILDEEKISRSVVIGHSLGGYISMAFAEKYKERLTGLGLFHSSAFADSEEKKAARKKGIETIKANGAPEFLKTSTPNLFSPRFPERNLEAVTVMLTRTSTFSSQTLIAYYEAMAQRPDRTALFLTLEVPVLFIAGVDDTAIPLHDVLKQCHIPNRSNISVLGESGHMGMIEEKEKANKILGAFLHECVEMA